MSDDVSQPTQGRFEIERDGLVSYLAYETDGREGISLLHTEVPPSLRHHGIANELAKMALEHAKEKHLKVEVICPVVHHFLSQHPEYRPLVRLPTPYKPTT
jgi:predicted GNAT family acetyltransferase